MTHLDADLAAERYVVMFSGGITSWAAARRIAEERGTDSMILLFADTQIEDEDTYRFLPEAASSIGAPLVTVADGRDVWQVFHDERFLGNSQVDPCSKILKRELLRRWVTDHCDAADTSIVLGLDWTEGDRIATNQHRWAPWTARFPLNERPYRMKHYWLDQLRAEGIEPPRLYRMGFPHNNCGGFCIKAGQGSFALLLEAMPERYAYHERREQEIREFLGKDVAILKHRSGPKEGQPLTLKELRERREAGEQCDLFDLGGCGCVA
jgi:hypothetical protein